MKRILVLAAVVLSLTAACVADEPYTYPRLTGADYDELIVSGAPVDRGPCISLYGATVILLDGGDPESLGHGCMPLYEWDEAERVCVLHITVNAPCVGPERPPHEVRFDVSCAGEPESAVYYVSECEEAK